MQQNILHLHFGLLCFVYGIGDEMQALYVFDKHSATELHSQPIVGGPLEELYSGQEQSFWELSGIVTLGCQHDRIWNHPGNMPLPMLVRDYLD